MQPPSDTGGTTSELAGAKQDAKHLGQTAMNRVHSEVDARKDEAATQARSVSSAIDRAAGNLDEGAPDWLKSAFRKGADQMQRFAVTIEQKDSRQLVADISDFARNSPGTFLAGCAAAGFAAARVIKAGGEGSGGSSKQRTSGDATSLLDPTADRSAYEGSFPASGPVSAGSPTGAPARGEFA